MSDPLRTDTSRALDAASDSDRDAKIEQLLLVGLDHYFAAQYEQAVNVWTRALFLDRSHPKARAYIERARSALAERQRESEELLQNGLAAFQRGEADEARGLLQKALSRGAPSDEALAILDRMNRLEENPALQRRPQATRSGRPPAAAGEESGTPAGASALWLVWLLMIALVAGGAVYASSRMDWRSLLTWEPVPAPPSATAPADPELPLPQRGEVALTRARSFIASGHLREALAALEEVKVTDPQKVEADQLRERIQRQLIALASVEGSAPAVQEKPDDRRP